MRRIFLPLLLIALWSPAAGQSLQGSYRSVERQVAEADRHSFSRLRDSRQIQRFVRLGLLVRVHPSSDLVLSPGVSYPYARPELQLFLQRLSSQFRAACGERLVVTSLTRPLREQPDNASKRSVHPTGMAVDLRISGSSGCRRWMERVLVNLERGGVVEATRERYPPHYHVALFPQPYTAYLASRRVGVDTGVRTEDSPVDAPKTHETAIETLQRLNRLPWIQVRPGKAPQLPP
jgi:hypothetical protein